MMCRRRAAAGRSAHFRQAHRTVYERRGARPIRSQPDRGPRRGGEVAASAHAARPERVQAFPGAADAARGGKNVPPAAGFEVGYKPRSEVFAAARGGSLVSLQDAWGRHDQVEQRVLCKHAAEAGANYPDPQVQKYAKAILARTKSDSALSPQALRAQLLGDAAAMEGKTLGSTKGYEPGPGGRDRPVFASGNEPDPAAQAEAQRLRTIAGLSDADLQKWALQQRDQNTFADLFSGNGVTNNREHQYTNLINDLD